MFTIFGSSGYIGNALTKHLSSVDQDVFLPQRNDISVYEKSLGHVIYAIGITADFRSKPFETIDAHICYLRSLLERANFESFVYLSSTRVYQGLDNSRVSEDDNLTVNPNDSSDLYNLSKLMGESLCLCSGKNVKVARLSNVIGGSHDLASTNFIPSLINEARNGHIVLQSGINSAKDYIKLEDVVSLLLNIATRGREKIYNVASGVNVTHREWIEKITQITRASFEFDTTKKSIIHPSINIDRCKKEFNFTPKDVLTNFEI